MSNERKKRASLDALVELLCADKDLQRVTIKSLRSSIHDHMNRKQMAPPPSKIELREAVNRYMSRVVVNDAETAVRHCIVRCGLQLRLRGIQSKRFSSDRVRLMHSILKTELGTISPTPRDIAKYKTKREWAKELDGIEPTNIVVGKRRL